MTGKGPPAEEVAEVVREVRALARRTGREDIAERIDGEAKRVRDAEVAVTVAGLSGSGKSALINAFAGRPVVAEGAATAVPTLVRTGPEAALVHLATGPRLESLTLEEARAWTGDASHDPVHLAVAVELWVPSTGLPANLLLIDTPPLDGGPAHGGVVTDAVSWRTDAVVFVTSASAPLSAEEVAFLRRVQGATAHVLVVVTRTDRYRGWRQVCADNADLLSDQLTQPVTGIFGVSARIRAAAGVVGEDGYDDSIAMESGVPHLIEHLRTEIVARQDDVRIANLLRSCETALYEVETALHEIRAAIADGEDAVVRALRAEADSVRLAGDEAQLLIRDGFASLREAATNEITREARAASAAVKGATAVEAVDDLSAEVADAVAAIADEFEHRSRLVIDAAEATRLGRDGGAEAVAQAVQFTNERGGAADEEFDGSDPLRYRLARSAASGGVGIALTAQRVVGGGDVVSALLAIGTLVGAATGVLAIRAAKRSQDLAAARRVAGAEIEDARLEATTALRQRALVRQREAEAALKQQIRLHLGTIQARLDEATKAARADAATRSRASAAASAELERVGALRQRIGALAAAPGDQRSKP